MVDLKLQILKARAEYFLQKYGRDVLLDLADPQTHASFVSVNRIYKLRVSSAILNQCKDTCEPQSWQRQQNMVFPKTAVITTFLAFKQTQPRWINALFVGRNRCKTFTAGFARYVQFKVEFKRLSCRFYVWVTKNIVVETGLSALKCGYVELRTRKIQSCWQFWQTRMYCTTPSAQESMFKYQNSASTPPPRSAKSPLFHP